MRGATPGTTRPAHTRPGAHPPRRATGPARQPPSSPAAPAVPLPALQARSIATGTSAIVASRMRYARSTGASSRSETIT